MTQTVGVGLLLLSGCQPARQMGDDFARLMSGQPTIAQSRNAKPVSTVRARNTAPAPAATTPQASASAEASLPASTEAIPNPTPPTEPVRPSIDGPTVSLAGKSETELQTMLGAPTSEEDRPPGKRWRYRDGQCTLDAQLYPDVQTKQFRTLAYEVKSDDNTDEGKRLCLAQLQSRLQARR